MDLNALQALFEKASLFELHRIKSLIEQHLEDPQRLQALIVSGAGLLTG